MTVVEGQTIEVTVRMVESDEQLNEATTLADAGRRQTAPDSVASGDAHAGVIRGRIVASDGGGPIVGMEVRINGGDRVTTTDREGSFRLEGVKPGHQQLWLRKDGFAFRIIDTDVVLGKDVVIDETIESATSLSLTLIGRNGRAYVGRAVLLLNATVAPGVGVGTNHEVVAQRDGRAVFRQIVAGSYRVQVIADGFSSPWTEVEVPSAGAELELRLR